MKNVFLLFVLLCTFRTAYGQNGTVKGTIRTSDGQAAEFVIVSLTGTSHGTASDKNGDYELRNVKPGSYVAVASFTGLKYQQQNVEVRAGETTIADFVLSENATELREVVISAPTNPYNAGRPSSSLRLQTPILETPQNIQVVTKQALDDQQAFDMLDGVQRNVSGAQRVEHWDNYALINMRGSQVTAFRNGMNVSMPWGPLTEDMSMVERIEFVKGPAGFMLASGEPSGFYNVVTKKPTGQQGGEVTFSFGSFDAYRVTTDIGGRSKTGRLEYRLNLMGQLKGSHRDFEFNNRYSIAPVIRYHIDERTAFTLEYNHQYSQMSVIGSNYSFSGRGYADLPVNFTTAEPNLDPTVINDRSVLAIFEHTFNSDWKITAQASYFNYSQVGQSIWPWGISLYNDSLMQRGISIWDALGINKNGQVFINGRVKTGGITHTLLGGLDMNHKDYYADWNQGAALGDSTFNIYDPQYGTVAAANIPQWDRSQDIHERGVRYNNSYNGIYVQDELAFFSNKLRVTIAGRYTTAKSINPYDGSTTDSKFTPRAGLSFSVTENTVAYFVYDQAFVANPGLDWERKSFDPITGDNIEAGLKKDWFNGTWNSVLSVYQITKNNVLTTDLEHPDPVTGQFVYNRQTGQQRVQGIEVDIRGQVLRNLEVIINYAYTDAIITKDSDPEITGNRVPGATRHLQNTWLNYRIGNGPLQGLRISLGYQYQAGRSSWYVFDGSENALPDYFRLDGGIGYSKNKFSVNVIVNNILNEYLFSGAPYGSMFYWQTEAPRNSRITFAYRF
jgi:iron complex outermembrane receptor protein